MRSSAPSRRALSGAARSCTSNRGAALPAAPFRSRPQAIARPKIRLATAALSTSTSTSSNEVRKAAAAAEGLPALKAQLLSALIGTGRGGSASAAARGAVEEAVLALEAAFALAEERGRGGGGEGEEDDDGDDDGGVSRLLPGRWRLIYTTALDVAPLLTASEAAGSIGSATASAFFPEGLPVPRIGNIYQEFESLPSSNSSSNFAPVRNVITFHLPPLLDSLTATVSARYEVRSRRRLRLVFDRAALGEARPSRAAETLLAPVLLPRGTLQKNLLMLLRSAEVGVPLSARGAAGSSGLGVAASGLLGPLTKPARELVDGAVGRARDAAGGEYLISFLDGENLIGRQTAGGGGVFIFARDDDDEEVLVDEEEKRE